MLYRNTFRGRMSKFVGTAQFKLHTSVHKGLDGNTAEVLMTKETNAVRQAIDYVNIFNLITFDFLNRNNLRASNDCLRLGRIQEKNPKHQFSW